MRKGMQDNSTKSGFVLVVVLLGLGVLGALTAGFVRTATESVRLAANLVQEVKAEALASAGAHLAARELQERAHGRDTPIHPDGRPYVCRLPEPGAVLQLIVENEDGKIDINTASDHLLETLLLAVGASATEAPALVARIADYRDEDNLPRIGGTERDAYKAAGLTYAPSNTDFKNIEELERVLDFPPWLYARVLPHITTYNKQSGFDPDAISEDLIGLLSVSPRQAWPTAPVRPGARPSRPVVGPRQLPAALGRYVSISDNRYFRVFSTVRLASGMRYTRDAVIAMAARPGERPSFERWMTALDVDVADVGPINDC